MEEKMKSIYTSTNKATGRKSVFKNYFFTLFSLGTIISGAWACPASMGIGVSLVLIGTILFTESGFQVRWIETPGGHNVWDLRLKCPSQLLSDPSSAAPNPYKFCGGRATDGQT